MDTFSNCFEDFDMTSFSRFFELATGQQPYAYQRELGELPQPPSVLNVPTGAGKTQALIVSWLYSRRELGVAPRRLVYALPMRTLVEQTVDVARDIRSRLEIDDEELPIHVLMGGAEPAELRDWRLSPERDQILIGTIDMLLSRALNRGYAESRFAWPVAFGLLNNDCRWVFDEVQLMGSARATSAQLDGLRAKLGTILPCETVWSSATIDRTALRTVDRTDLGGVLSLPSEDRKGALRVRLDARKTLERLEVGESTGGELAAHVAQAAVDRHQKDTRTLVVLNTVELAQSVYRALGALARGADVESVLLHSRFRPVERAANMRRALAEPEGEGTIVVATQVVEAGVDFSARTLVTETAPFLSVVQRLGRCNRAGEFEQAAVVWLDRGPLVDETIGRKLAAPYRLVDIAAARSALLGLEGVSLSPAALEQIEVAESPDDPAI
ncbi:MAG TPA: DEAD/DEAH box helicase, partial [Solirubrobacteraceae bacterium]|nr:DEAD/DEAH box helicase [Solirubrobacteraceae bacterium]